jgi:hypothetical protein
MMGRGSHRTWWECHAVSCHQLSHHISFLTIWRCYQLLVTLNHSVSDFKEDVTEITCEHVPLCYAGNTETVRRCSSQSAKWLMIWLSVGALWTFLFIAVMGHLAFCWVVLQMLYLWRRWSGNYFSIFIGFMVKYLKVKHSLPSDADSKNACRLTLASWLHMPGWKFCYADRFFTVVIRPSTQSQDSYWKLGCSQHLSSSLFIDIYYPWLAAYTWSSWLFVTPA